MHLNSACNNRDTVVAFLNNKFAEKKHNSNIYEILRDKNVPGAKKQRLVVQLLKRLPFLYAIRETVEIATLKLPNKDKDGNPIVSGKNVDAMLDYWDIEQKQLSPEDYATILEYYTGLLTELRNFYTHVDHDAVSFAFRKDQVPVKRYQLNLLHILTVALRETKKRFNYPARQENNNVDELLHLRRYDGVDVKATVTEQEYKAYKKRCEDGIADLLEMPIFKSEKRGTLMYSKMKENPNCRFFEKKGSEYVFTERGLAFFVSWFLQPDEIDKVFQKLPATKIEGDRRSKKFLAAKRAFGVFHINLPKTRIESVEKMTRDTLGMDMIAEMHKTPGVIWNYLDLADQKRIRAFANKLPTEEQPIAGTSDNQTNDEDESQDTDYSGRRAKNRFPYLALSYLDLSEAYDTIRFRMDWGNYVFDHYKKRTLDGANTDRRLQKRIYSFERMQDAYKWFNTNRHAEGTLYYETDSENEPPKEFRVPMVPQYAINTKKQHIGITFGDVKQPEFTGKTTRRTKPHALLNLADLPVLVFLSVHGLGKEAETLINDYYTSYCELLQALKDGKKMTIAELEGEYGISRLNLPMEIGYYIETGKLSAPKESKQMQNKLAKILDETQRILKNFMDEAGRDFKPGDKRKPRWKSGNIGDYLAHDLVKLQRPNPDKPHHGKITGVNFDALQAALATYRSNDAGTIKEIFAKAGLINNPNYPHPFLNELVDERGVKSATLQFFFKSYLDKKIAYIKSWQKDPKQLYLLDSLQRKADSKQKPEYIAQLAEHYLNEPLILPKFLFDSIVEDLVKKECAEKYALKEKETQKKNRGMNTPFLITHFHQWKYADASQWFYALPHGITSESLKKITNILKPKISKHTGKNGNQVGLSDSDQKQLYDRWAKITDEERKQKKPLLIPELNAIAKKFKTLWQKNFQKPQDNRENVDYREKLACRVNRIEKQEQQMRLVKLQDIVLFHAACKLLNITGQAKLGDIQESKPYLLGQDERELSREFQIPTTSARYEKEKQVVTITGKMKIKNSGNFNRMTSDPRIFSLLRLLTRAGNCAAVDYEHLRKELDMFDRKRKDVFEWVHSFESQILKKYPGECVAKRKKEGYVDFWSCCEVLIDKGELTIGQALALANIRNGFSHHHLFEFEYAEQKTISAEENAAAKQYFGTLRQRLIGKPLDNNETMVERVLEILHSITI